MIKGSDEDDEMEPKHLSALEDPCCPSHRRCMAHTLNVIAKDLEKIIERQYKTLSIGMFLHRCLLCGMGTQSPKASHFVKEKLDL